MVFWVRHASCTHLQLHLPGLFDPFTNGGALLLQDCACLPMSSSLSGFVQGVLQAVGACDSAGGPGGCPAEVQGTMIVLHVLTICQLHQHVCC